MKKFISMFFAALLLFAFAGCTPPEPDDSSSSETPPSGSVTNGRAEDWEVTAGGKKYQVIADDDTIELYDDAAIEQNGQGIRFSGSGGFWDKQDGTSGAGAGGVYKLPIDATNGFSVSFTIDTIGRYDTVHVNGGNWDSWFAFGIVNKAKMFTTKTATEDPAEGLIGLLIPFETPSDGHTGSIIMYDCGMNWSYKGDNNQDGVMQGTHTLELRKSEDEWGVEYSLYFDGIKINGGGALMESRFNTLFPDGKVYLQFYMQNWNARPKVGDVAEDKVYPSSAFTVHSITVGDTVTSFAKKA